MTEKLSDKTLAEKSEFNFFWGGIVEAETNKGQDNYINKRAGNLGSEQ